MTRHSKEFAFAYLSATAPTTCTFPAVYYFLEGTFTNERLLGFSIDPTNGLTYDGEGGFFQVILNATFSSNTNNNEVSLALFKNGVLEPNSVMTAELNSTTDKIPIPVVDVLALENGDYVDIRIASDKAISQVTAETVTTSAVRI